MSELLGALNQVIKIKMPSRSTMNKSHKQNVEWKKVYIKYSTCDVILFL